MILPFRLVETKDFKASSSATRSACERAMTVGVIPSHSIICISGFAEAQGGERRHFSHRKSCHPKTSDRHVGAMLENLNAPSVPRLVHFATQFRLDPSLRIGSRLNVHHGMELPARGERSLARTFCSHLCLEREHVGVFLRAPFRFLFVIVVVRCFFLFVPQLRCQGLVAASSFNLNAPIVAPKPLRSNPLLMR